MDSDLGNCFHLDLLLAQEKVHAGVTAQPSDVADREWDGWTAYRDKLGVHPLLEELEDPIPFFRVYDQGYCTGKGLASGHPARSCTVEDSLQNVGQTFTCLGANDPRRTWKEQIDFRLRLQLSAYTQKKIRLLEGVKPVPCVPTFIQNCMAIAVAGTDSGIQAIANMIAITFFASSLADRRVHCFQV